MRLPRTLCEMFSMPGFAARSTLRPMIGDDKARVVTLTRQKKQRFARAVATAAVAVTTSECSRRVTFRRRLFALLLSSSAGV